MLPCTLHRSIVPAVVFGALAVLAAGRLEAQQQPPSPSAGDAIRFRIQASGRDLYRLAIPLPLGERSLAEVAMEVASNDLALAGFFKVLDPKSFLANLVLEQLSISPQDWRNVGAEGVIKMRATGYGADIKYEFRLYEVTKGDQPVLSKDYRGSQAMARALVHQFAGDVVRYFTGEDNFFNSRVAFASSSGQRRRDLFLMDWDGNGTVKLTDRSQNMLPAWAPSGRQLVFTSFLGGKPDLYLLDVPGGRSRMLSNRSGINTGAAFSPDGTKVAATLSFEGNSEIYLLDTAGAVLKRLTNNPFIDTSPSWSADGARIAFVSDRHGTPQIWVMNADGSNQRRLTHRGNYNQTPCWSPRSDVPLIAFTARDEKLSYDIFTVNADTEEMVRITENQGSNQHPSWAPNGRALVYESSRGGLWISTADGRTERQVYKGGASAPAWGPSSKSGAR